MGNAGGARSTREEYTRGNTRGKTRGEGENRLSFLEYYVNAKTGPK